MSSENIVFTTADVMEANLVKSLLESNNVAVFMMDENVSRIHPGYNPALGGIKLLVPLGQVEHAKLILREYRGTEGKDPTTGQPSPFEFIGRDSTNPFRLFVVWLSSLLTGFLPFPIAKRKGKQNVKRNTQPPHPADAGDKPRRR